MSLALPTGPWLVCLAAAIVAGIFIFRWDSERRTARILYDVDDPEILERMAMISGVGEWLSRSSRVWHIYSAVQTGDWKHNAGASTIVKRTPTGCTRGTLPRIELNIEPWCVPVGPQRLLFLPDRMLVLEGSRFAGVPYEQLSVTVQRKRFVEEEAVPPDAPFVEHTWRFVNKSGGPDRRFANNRKFPSWNTDASNCALRTA